MARISLYVENHFAIFKENEILNIDLIGAELVDDYIFIYQEWPNDLAGNISIKNHILRTNYPQQISQVNIIREDIIKTLTFSEGDVILHLSNK